ncbi:hypothetical protein EVAR_23615_1 [Eumeta japonica]|uniref:Mos1 transposase HTH domain-containing protein n=1 Tax=Eumeta variegata TaxID=151549 RepID=A0A4C1X1J3_EUMVA|nr:hypothetical protein EVAR_23615_1 [Eumeta japonica]
MKIEGLVGASSFPSTARAVLRFEETRKDSNYFAGEAPCRNTIYNWFAEFKRGRVNLSAEFRDDRASAAVNDKNIDAVCLMIETDRHVNYHEIRTYLD